MFRRYASLYTVMSAWLSPHTALQHRVPGPITPGQGGRGRICHSAAAHGEQNVVQRVAEHRARSANSEVRLRTCCGTIFDNRSIQRSRSEHHNPTQPQRSASSNHDEQELAMAGIGARTQVSGGSAQNCPMAAKARTVQEQNAFTPVVAGAKTSGYAGHLVGR